MINTALCPLPSRFSPPAPSLRQHVHAPKKIWGLQNMASRLIKIRLPFLFLFCLEMFKENCLRMSESHREGFDPWKKSLSSGSGTGADPTRPTCPKSRRKQSFLYFFPPHCVYLRNLKPTSTYFQGIHTQTTGAEGLHARARRLKPEPG